jgi:hypothetical protein
MIHLQEHTSGVIFYDMVVDGVIPSLKYIDLFVSNIG